MRRLAEGERAVVKEGHDKSASHRINVGRTVFGGGNLLELQLLEDDLGGERSLGHEYGLNAFLLGAESGDIELVEIAVAVYADGFQGLLGVFQVLRQEFILERLRGLRILEGAVI